MEPPDAAVPMLVQQLAPPAVALDDDAFLDADTFQPARYVCATRVLTLCAARTTVWARSL